MSVGTRLLQAAAGNAGGGAVYVDDVFSTFVYEGNGGTQGIPNGIKLGDFGVGTSTKFDRNVDFLSRSSDLTGNADGKTFTFSCWVFLTPKFDDNVRTLYATDSSDNGILIYIHNNNRFDIEAWNSGVRTLQIYTSTVLPTNAWANILVSLDTSNSSNRHIYFNDVAASVNYSTYNNANIEFTRPTHYIGIWGNGTTRGLHDDNLAHFYLDYTYRDLSTESNRRIFIDANGGSTSASSLAALNPIMYLPMTTAYAVGKNEGTGGDFTSNGSPTIVENGTEYVSGEGKGGLIWTKARDSSSLDNVLVDTERATGWLVSNGTQAAAGTGTAYLSFNSNGYDIDNAFNNWNGSTIGDYVSWTFRKQEKFFDIQTWSGNGTAGRVISHDLGSVPGMIIIKCTNSAGEPWYVYHRETDSSAPEDYHLKLNSSNARSDSDEMLNDTAPTSTGFTVTQYNSVNGSGNTYIAYLFAHDEQDFGEDSDEAIIKCGSFSGTGQVDLGFEPQWIMYKPYSQSWDWEIADNIRGLDAASSSVRKLEPNTSDAEANGSDIKINATGFYNGTFGVSYPCIYVAIRRPHKPASEFAATDLFTPVSQNFAPGIIPAGFPIDLIWHARQGTANYKRLFDRLRGATKGFYTDQNNADVTHNLFAFDNMTGFEILPGTTIDAWSWMMFRRAPGFLDVVSYTGTGSATTVTHNLGVAPEMMILKNRTDASSFQVYHSANPAVYHLELNNTNARNSNGAVFNSTAPTSSVFSVGTQNNVNGSGKNLMAYLFASVDGISKVGSYTGTGNDVNVDCGFSSGARIVIAKRSDSTGGWYLWDSARGIVAGNDSYFLVNDEAAQVTNTDYIDPLASGFTITSSAPAELNASGGTYVFLAVA